jgi:hypothetical protein
LVFYAVTAVLAFGLMLAVWLLHRENRLRVSLQILLTRLLVKWRKFDDTED